MEPKVPDQFKFSVPEHVEKVTVKRKSSEMTLEKASTVMAQCISSMVDKSSSESFQSKMASFFGGFW